MKTFLFKSAILASIILTSCVKDTDGKIDITKILTLTLSPSNNDTVKVTADGTTKIKLTATLGELSDDKKNIVFYSSNGELIAFDGGTTSNNISQLSINKEASVQLRTSTVPDEGVFVTAKVDNYLVKRFLVFTISYPDTIFVKPDAFFTTSDKIEIEIELLKLKGLVSSKVPVYFKVISIDTNGLMVNIDPYKFSDNANKSNPATIRNTLQKINDNKGKVSVEISTLNSRGVLIKKVLQLEFK
jgi:hypothetical protein